MSIEKFNSSNDTIRNIITSSVKKSFKHYTDDDITTILNLFTVDNIELNSNVFNSMLITDKEMNIFLDTIYIKLLKQYTLINDIEININNINNEYLKEIIVYIDKINKLKLKLNELINLSLITNNYTDVFIDSFNTSINTSINNVELNEKSGILKLGNINNSNYNVKLDIHILTKNVTKLYTSNTDIFTKSPLLPYFSNFISNTIDPLELELVFKFDTLTPINNFIFSPISYGDIEILGYKTNKTNDDINLSNLKNIKYNDDNSNIELNFKREILKEFRLYIKINNFKLIDKDLTIQNHLNLNEYLKSAYSELNKINLDVIDNNINITNISNSLFNVKKDFTKLITNNSKSYVFGFYNLELNNKKYVTYGDYTKSIILNNTCSEISYNMDAAIEDNVNYLISINKFIDDIKLKTSYKIGETTYVDDIVYVNNDGSFITNFISDESNLTINGISCSPSHCEKLQYGTKILPTHPDCNLLKNTYNNITYNVATTDRYNKPYFTNKINLIDFYGKPNLIYKTNKLSEKYIVVDGNHYANYELLLNDNNELEYKYNNGTNVEYVNYYDVQGDYDMLYEYTLSAELPTTDSYLNGSLKIYDETTNVIKENYDNGDIVYYFSLNNNNVSNIAEKNTNIVEEVDNVTEIKLNQTPYIDLDIILSEHFTNSYNVYSLKRNISVIYEPIEVYIDTKKINDISLYNNNEIPTVDDDKNIYFYYKNNKIFFNKPISGNVNISFYKLDSELTASIELYRTDFYNDSITPIIYNNTILVNSQG